METSRKIEEIQKEIEELNALFDKKKEIWDNSKSWKEYCDFFEIEFKRFEELDREKRMIMPYTLEEIPDYGDVMSLKDFIAEVNAGNFIDYDGFGQYAKNNTMSDICIIPSDVKHNAIRKDFDTVVWFNK